MCSACKLPRILPPARLSPCTKTHQVRGFHKTDSVGQSKGLEKFTDSPRDTQMLSGHAGTQTQGLSPSAHCTSSAGSVSAHPRHPQRLDTMVSVIPCIEGGMSHSLLGAPWGESPSTGLPPTQSLTHTAEPGITLGTASTKRSETQGDCGVWEQCSHVLPPSFCPKG